ncbi:MAG: hypothetical protein ACI9D5_001421 [Candidatus Endobugula sp.]|jgi:hypothetical protein
MTTGTWDPSSPSENSTSYTLDIEFLKKIIKTVGNNTEIEVSSYLTADEQKTHSPVMRLSKATWFTIKESLSNDDIITLIKFFTLAEMQLSDWSGEEHSPVIWLTKILKQKGGSINKDLLLWIKSKNDNKFLPYGAL